MMFFLKLVGAILVALILLLVGGFFFLKFKFRKFASKFAEAFADIGAAPVPPFRIKLQSREKLESEQRQYAEDDEYDDDDEFFMNEQDVQEQSVSFESLGFELIGDFQSDAMFSMRAFGHKKESTYAVIYDHFAIGVWCDVYRGYLDGTSWTYSTAKDHGMDSPPGKRQRFFPGTETAEVVRQFWKDAPVNEIQTDADDQFARYFEKKYAEEMNWHIQRGGPSEQEIHRIAEQGGVECTPEMVKATQDQWEQAISQFLEQRAIKQFNKDNGVSKKEAMEREYRVVAIHDRMPTTRILESIYEDFYLDLPPDEDDDHDPSMERWRNEYHKATDLRKSRNVVDTFKAILDESGEQEKFEQLGTVTKPVAAEIWLRPEDEDAYADEFDDEEDDYDEDLDDLNL